MKGRLSILPQPANDKPFRLKTMTCNWVKENSALKLQNDVCTFTHMLYMGFCTEIWRILHGGAKIRSLFSSGKKQHFTNEPSGLVKYCF